MAEVWGWLQRLGLLAAVPYDSATKLPDDNMGRGVKRPQGRTVEGQRDCIMSRRPAPVSYAASLTIEQPVPTAAASGQSQQVSDFLLQNRPVRGECHRPVPRDVKVVEDRVPIAGHPKLFSKQVATNTARVPQCHMT